MFVILVYYTGKWLKFVIYVSHHHHHHHLILSCQNHIHCWAAAPYVLVVAEYQAEFSHGYIFNNIVAP